ncbi:MAG: hypothetical protein PHW95_04425 [Patescibacteria group bacterium]|nr:hypothetical protein [Patescibacteria group bacterium]
MIKKISLLLAVAAIILSGCQLKENYSVQYGFSNELETESTFIANKDGYELTSPFADFTCDSQSVKANLARNGNIFTMILSGTETTQRCSYKFFAKITGVNPGDYEFKLIYQRDNLRQQVMYQQFSVSK